ncbi:unnamed protein product [Lactuca virosa]|uniref:DNA helicase n=1 Tax=Lactuca virosa TaxID=75947 RepID=A0AAU9M427_9ASTR|nr:unnamed protein product [Lactuca virosa]
MLAERRNKVMMLVRAEQDEGVEEDESVKIIRDVYVNVPEKGAQKHPRGDNIQVGSSDLITYGLIPEFVVRFPILDNLLALTNPQLVQVLTDPKNVLGKQYNKLYQMNVIPDERTCKDLIDDATNVDRVADGGAKAEMEVEAELPSIAAM